jgi:hypothetical protein
MRKGVNLMDTVIIFDTIIIPIMNFDQPEQQPHDDNLTHLIDRMDTIERKLDLILQKLDASVIKNCDKMGSHIDFVNGVYATVKVPLNYISTRIHKLANPFGSPKELPAPLLHDDNNEIMQ